jgi:hypothetical protein
MGALSAYSLRSEAVPALTCTPVIKTEVRIPPRANKFIARSLNPHSKRV